MKHKTLITTALLGLGLLTGCSDTPPSFEECARKHIEFLQDAQRNGFTGPTVSDKLEEEGCGIWYTEELTRRAQLMFPPPATEVPIEIQEQGTAEAPGDSETTEPMQFEEGYVDPLAGVDEGRPPDNTERGFSCSSPEVGVTVCEGNVPSHIDHITPEEYNSSR